MDSGDPIPLGYPVATQKFSSHRVCQEHYCSVYGQSWAVTAKKITGTWTCSMFGCFSLHSSYLPSVAIFCVQQDPWCCHQLCCERLLLYLSNACECVHLQSSYKPPFHIQQRWKYVRSAPFMHSLAYNCWKSCNWLKKKKSASQN